jgi:hypothetical protein
VQGDELKSRDYEALEDNNNDVAKHRDNSLLPWTSINLSFRAVFSPELGQKIMREDNLEQLFNHLFYQSITLESTVDAYQENVKNVTNIRNILKRELEEQS